MKKLMFATALVAGVALNGLCLESANIVGYQEIALTNDYALYTATFQKIGGDGTFNLNDIKVYKNGVLCEDTTAKLTIYKLDDEGEYGTPYGWRKRTESGTGVTNIGWHRTTTYQPDLSINDGEGICFKNSYNRSDKITIRISGQVNLTPASGEIKAGKYSLVGNMTPVAKNLQDFKVYVGDVIPEPATAAVTAFIMDKDGEYSSPYGWRRRTVPGTGVTNIGWHRLTTYQPDIMIQPGEAICVKNGSTDTIRIKMSDPTKAAE